MKRIYYLAMLFLSFANLTVGQSSLKLEGQVLDENAQPLPGANIYIPELNLGSSANAEGYYKITGVKKGRYLLQFSFLGYETYIYDIKISDKDTTINVELHLSAFQSEEVVISGGRFSSQHENAIKIETINVNSIQTSGSSSLMESIAQIPGVDVISKSNAVATPVIRGLSTSNILVLNNGIRMENYQFSENHPYLIDEFGIEKTEVIKGPASLLYGSDAIGGVLNFIRERPTYPNEVAGDINLQYFSNSQGANGNIGFKGSGKKLYWGLRGGVKSHADYLEGSGDFVPNSRFNQSGIKSFGGFRSSIGNFRIYYDYVNMKPGMTVQPVIDENTSRGRKNEIWYQDLNTHLISSKNEFFLNSLKLETNVAYQYNHRKLNGSEESDSFTQVDAILNTINYEVKSNITSSEKSHFIIAIQGMSQSNRNQDAPSHVLPDYNLNDISLSGLVQHDFKSGIHLQFGLRFDNRFIYVPEQELHGHSHDEEEEEEEEEEMLEKLDQQYGNLSGSFGITYKLSEHFLIRTNIASAYRTPNIAELTQDGQHGTRYEQGDRNLKSQRNYEGDLSVHYHSKHLLFDIAGFYNLVDNYIFLAPTNDTTHDGDQIYRYSQNDATLYGFEAIAEVLITDQLGIKGGYSYIRGEQSNGENLPFIPHNKLTAEIKWNKKKIWKFDDLYVKVGSITAFDQNNPATFETKTSGYTLLNAGIGLVVKFGSQTVQLDVIGSNLTNRNYIDHLSTLKDIGYHNPGRNIMINLKIPLQIKKSS